MRIVKWSPYSPTNKESPSAPIWLTFYNLPVHFFAKSMLFAIVSAFGNLLKIDEPTKILSRSLVVKNLVEVDVSKKENDRIWLDTETDGLYQHVIFENMPYYCLGCFNMGHFLEKYHVKSTSVKDPI